MADVQTLNMGSLRENLYKPKEGAKLTFDIKHLEVGADLNVPDVPQETYNPELKKQRPKTWELDVRGMISSQKWLLNYGLKRNRLDMKNILPMIGFKHASDFDFALKKPISSRYGQGMFTQFGRADGSTFNITCGKEKLKQIENRLSQAILLYKRRMEWLTTESRRIFGVVQEHCVSIVLDIKNMSPQQFDQYRAAVERIIREQLSQLAKFNILRAAEDMEPFKSECVPVTQDSLDEAVKWLWALDRVSPISKTATCEAVLRSLQDPHIEAVYLFTEGQSSDGSRELLKTKLGIQLTPYMEKLHGGPMPVHVVSYNCTSSDTMQFLKNLSTITGGRFHAYAVTMEMDSYEGMPPDPSTNKANIVLRRKTYGGIPPGAGVREDVLLIFEELETARNNLAQIQALMDEVPDPKVYQKAIERSPSTSSLESSEQTSSNKPKDRRRMENYMSSTEWLGVNGLKTKKLGFYDVLGGVAFKHCDGVVDVKTKPDESDIQTDAKNKPRLVNAKYCERFAHVRWKDGKVVHVQVTPEVHRNYESRMDIVLESIHQRINWLQQGSRELFGTVLENQIYFLIDTSASMAPHIDFVKEKILILMQEQLRHKQKFNIISFNSKAQPWRDRLVEVSERNLQSSWSWIQGLECVGSTNTLAALKFALADQQTQAIYLLTDGRPDHPPKTVLAQVQLSHSVPIHSISFNCSDVEANKFLCQLAKDSGGRYHYYSDNGNDPDSPEPWESEDIRILRDEYKEGEKNLLKVAQLRDECAKLAWRKETHTRCNRNHELSNTDRTSAVPALPPKELYRSLSRPKSATGFRPSYSTAPRPMTARSSGHMRRSSCPSRPETARSRGGIKPLIAGHTRTSLLRTLGGNGRFDSNEWLLPETRALFESQWRRQKQTEDSEELSASRFKKRTKKLSDTKSLDMSSGQWLRKHGLKARNMTILDVLGPTMISHQPKYVPILNKMVLSKVFDDILPVAHASGKRKQIRLVNPLGVDLISYEAKLEKLIDKYRKRLNDIVWHALPQSEKDSLGGNGPLEFTANKLSLMQSLDHCGWPVSERDIVLLEDEITQAQKYNQQSKELRKLAERKGESEASAENQNDSSNSESDDEEKESVHQYSDNNSEKSEKSDNKSDKESVKNSNDGDSKGSKVYHYPVKNEKRLEKPTTLSKVTKVLDTMRGQSVLARSDRDGMYYPGFVIKCSNTRHALVEFNNKVQQYTTTRFMMPTGGATARPQLRVGDCVLSRIKNADNDQECYLPGVVQATPMRSNSQARFYTVNLYTNQQVTTMRNFLMKISKARYTFTVRYIQETVQQRELADVDKDKNENITSPRSQSESDHSCTSSDDEEEPTMIIKDTAGIPIKKKSQEQINEVEMDKMDNQEQKRLQDLHDLLLNQQNTHRKQQRKLKRQTVKLAKNQRRDMKQIQKKDKSVGEIQELKKELVTKQSESDLEDQKNRIKDWLSEQLDDATPRQPTNETTEAGSPVLNKMRKGLPPAEEGEEVLARWLSEGWYYRGTVKKNCGDCSYYVEDSTGDMERVYREDIITEKDDANNVIKPKDPVVALHPDYSFSYAPGVVLDIYADLALLVRFYDTSEATLPREEVYKMMPEKFEHDVTYILKCEGQWLGQAVVVRREEDGIYSLATVKQKIGNCHNYVVEWADGSLAVSSDRHMFGAITKHHQLVAGDRVLAIADLVQLVYLPGVVTGITGNKVTVKFCNGSVEDIDMVHCFWLSQDYFDDAVSYIKSRK